MKTILIEYCPDNAKSVLGAKFSYDAVHNHIRSSIRSHQAMIQGSKPRRQISIMLKGVKVCVVEVRP